MAHKNTKSKSRIFLMVCSVIVGLVGLCILLYPFASQYYYGLMQAKMIDSYVDSMKGYKKEQYDALYGMACDYNGRLYENGISFENIEAQRSTLINEGFVYDDILNPKGNGVMGYLVIDKIHVKLPISHGVSEDVLKEGIGHLEGTSFPTEGDSVHSVLFGHRGLPSSVLFTDLDRLQEGDVFEIYTADRILTYTVDRVVVVLPEETDDLLIEEGNNDVTLLTCTPYGVNTHRLHVRGVLTGVRQN